MVSSLYVHIPFCAHICRYCDFAKVFYRDDWAFSYLQEIKKEIAELRISHPLKTIYVGGGTPTCLSESMLDDLLSFLRPYLEEDGEFSVEANPETITPEKLGILCKNKVNRLSLGIQSSLPKYLSLMGRKHTFEEAKEAIFLAKKAGFSNLSVDLIYGLPGQNLSELDSDISAFLALDLPHLSAYSLTVNPGTEFYAKGFQEAEDELAGAMYERILFRLRKAGYERYEVSNFAKNGHYCRHNLTYWKDEEYYAAGLGASGYLGKKRYVNTRNLSTYLKGKHRSEEEKLTLESELEDFFLTNLRLASGFAEKTFEKRFGFSFFSRYQNQFETLHKMGLLEQKEGCIRATDRGILLLDRILINLF